MFDMYGGIEHETKSTRHPESDSTHFQFTLYYIRIV